MTIDEALDFIDNINRTVTFSKECQEDEDFFGRVAEWLEELKVLREYMKSGLIQQVRENAIEEFLDELKNYTLWEEHETILEIVAEQLKEHNFKP